MKKYLKSLIVAVTVICVCLSLAGCQSLDNARANHAVWTESGSIMLSKTEYIALPASDTLQPDFNSNYEDIYVTEADVPVLLSAFIGTPLSLSDDQIFLIDYSNAETVLYCRTDKYDEILKGINGGAVLSSYCYSYIDYNDENFSAKYYMLTKDQAQTIETVISSVEPTVMPEIAEISYDYLVNIEKCSADMLFREYSCDIYLMNDSYYISKDTETDTLLYTVPETLKETFEDIMSKHVESENYWSEDFYDEEIYTDDL